MGNSEIIKVFEDKQRKVSLSKEQISDLTSMKSLIGENNLILQTDGKILIKHYVGFVQLNKTRLLIYPKISSASNDEAEYIKSFEILMKLLAFSDFTGLKRTPTPQMLDKYNGDLLEAFVGIFVDELLLQFKRDVNRGYNNILENQSFIKGKVDFSETVKKNSFRKHLHYVRYDQFSEDILLNKIFKSIVRNLIVRTNCKSNKLKLQQTLLWLEDVEAIALDNEIWDTVKFTRHNNKYEAAFNMAKLFYFNTSPNLNAGDELAFSFLVPVNRLFESYLYKVFKKAKLLDQRVNYQGPIDYLSYSEGKKYFQLRPDITLSKEDRITCVIDAKYKNLFYDGQSLKLSQGDIYQMLAYSVRYQCNDIILAYPRYLDETHKDMLIQELKIKNYNQEVTIKLIKIDLELNPELLAMDLKFLLDESSEGNPRD